MGKIICFANNKGGVGKTTSASSIGLTWAKMGKKVLFIDLDSQANLTSLISETNTLDQTWDKTLEDAFIGGTIEGLPILHSQTPNVDYVPTDLGLASFEKDTARYQLQMYLLTDLLKPIKENYDYIIIDCPPSLSTLTYNALIASDHLVLVTNPEGTSYRGLIMMINMYNEIVANERFNPELKLAGVLITRYENDKVAKMHINTFRESLGEYLVEPFIPKSTKVNQSTSFGKSIFEIDPNGKVAEAYMQAAQELMVRIENI